MKLGALIIAACLCLCVPFLARAEVWMTHIAPQELARPGGQWTYVRQRLDTLEIYINCIAFLIPQNDLKELVSVLKLHGIEVAIECGYFDWYNDARDFTALNPKGIKDVVRERFDDRVGEETAEIEMRKIANLLDAGCEPAYLNLDGCIRRMMHPGSDVGRHVKGFDSLDRCADELIDYMRAWRRRFPRIKFFALTNFPNWGWKGEVSYWGGGMFYGDYHQALRKIIDKTRAAGIPIAGVTADNPYEYFAGTHPHKAWMDASWQESGPNPDKDPASIGWTARALDLERFVRSENLEFNLIANSAIGGGASAEAFCTGTLDYVDAYRRAGGRPTRYIVQSWYKYPEKVVPGTEPCTMTWLVKKVMQKLNPAP